MTPFAWLRWTRRILSVLVGLIVVGALYIGGQVYWAGKHDQKQDADVILVLGAAQYNGRPSEVFQARLDHAHELYEQGYAPRIMTVGAGRTGDTYTEAQAGAMYLEQHGVSSTGLVTVGEGSDTLLSLRAADKVMQSHHWHSVLIVTDPWHVLRSRTMARDLGLTAHASPVTTGPSVHGVGTKIKYISRESVAYVYYRLFHRASRSGPSAV